MKIYLYLLAFLLSFVAATPVAEASAVPVAVHSIENKPMATHRPQRIQRNEVLVWIGGVLTGVLAALTLLASILTTAKKTTGLLGLGPVATTVVIVLLAVLLIVGIVLLALGSRKE